jgi:hypothetical protein
MASQRLQFAFFPNQISSQNRTDHQLKKLIIGGAVPPNSRAQQAKSGLSTAVDKLVRNYPGNSSCRIDSGR